MSHVLPRYTGFSAFHITTEMNYIHNGHYARLYSRLSTAPKEVDKRLKTSVGQGSPLFGSLF